MTTLSSIQAILGIDPGSSSGAFCLYGIDSGSFQTSNMPKSMGDLLAFLKAAHATYGSNIHAIAENVGGSRPGNSSRSSRTFSEHVGALKIGSTWVQPRKWMVASCGAGVPTGSSYAETKARKDYIYAALQTKYPGVKFTKRAGDAVGLMHYGRMLHSKGELL